MGGSTRAATDKKALHGRELVIDSEAHLGRVQTLISELALGDPAPKITSHAEWATTFQQFLEGIGRPGIHVAEAGLALKHFVLGHPGHLGLFVRAFPGGTAPGLAGTPELLPIYVQEVVEAEKRFHDLNVGEGSPPIPGALIRKLG